MKINFGILITDINININLKIIFIFSIFLSMIFSKEALYVFNLNIDGDLSMPESDLKDKIRLKSRGLFSKTEFNVRKIQLDEITLRNYYKKFGYNDVIISSYYEIFQENDVNVTFSIIEGDIYFIKYINLNGVNIFTNEEINELIDIDDGDVFNPVKIRKKLKKLKYKYLQRGKLNISIVEDIFLSNNEAIIEILISEGSTYVIRNISILGLDTVDKKYINRELLFNQNMVYDIEVINKTRERIFETGLFSSVEILPKITSNNELDIEILLREYKSREVSAEIGFNQLPSTQGDLPISAVNTTANWKIGQLFNTASTIHLDGQIGASYGDDQTLVRQYYEAYYTSPWILNFRIPVNFKMYYENIDHIENLSKLGLNTSFHYYVSSEVQLYGNIETEFITSSYISDVVEERSINLFFSKHTVKNHLSPENGYYISVMPSLHGTFLGGNFHYYKIDTEFKYYFSIYKGIILANRFKFGFLSKFNNYMTPDYDIQSFDKFHLGGQTSLRGWYSPDEFESNLPTGGTIRYLYNVELRYPVYRRVGMELFYDIGYLSDQYIVTQYDWDCGYGLTLDTGLGPARIDAAYKRGIGKPTILFSLLYMF